MLLERAWESVGTAEQAIGRKELGPKLEGNPRFEVKSWDVKAKEMGGACRRATKSEALEYASGTCG